MTPRKVAILQARMSSTRLPGKVLLDIAGKPVLQHMLERVRRSRLLDDILIATTTDPSDDVLAQFCGVQDIRCYRGSLPDVLDRYYQAALQCKADIIVRLTGDCPLVDSGVLDLTIQAFLGQLQSMVPTLPSRLPGSDRSGTFPYQFAANRLPPPWKRSLPIGLDVEVCSIDALKRAWQDARLPYQREHVLPYLYEGIEFTDEAPPRDAEWYIQHGITPRGFRVALLNHSPGYGDMRWTVDTPADLEFIREVMLRLGHTQNFSWKDVLSLLEKEPGLSEINAQVKHKSAYDVDEQYQAG